MHIKPEIDYLDRESGMPVYKCKCGERFTRVSLLNNKLSKGTREYCPKCKNKLNFK